ncbi:hypothetical protein QYM36_001678 [Artemia franciscana]|uniref:Uncharacterized protein n=1 Tax=Artemia franciscana TaxID=6661 RepID=A0AA88I6Y6_ARTSF|nr:hypothetical protein QYM36_001678 [Artemia franciscana]
MTELFHQPQNPSLKHLQNRIKARAEIVRLSNRNLIKMIKVTFLLALFAVLALAIAYPQEKTAVDADEEAASRGRYWGMKTYLFGLFLYFFFIIIFHSYK